MDCDEACDFYTTTDSQTQLVLEFNNQASLKNHDKFQATNEQELSVTKLPVMGIENNWSEEKSYLTPPSHDFPIPLPPPSGFDDISSCITEHDPTTFAGDIAALFSPTELQVEGMGDLFDMGAEAGVCGLRNLGNTCFMSTGVQCLMATPTLVNCFLEQNSLIKDSLIAHLSSLTQKIWSGQYSAVQPSDFKEILGVRFPQFKDFRQHDCQEFLALLLDGLHEQMNSAVNHVKVCDENKECLNTACTDLNARREMSTSYEQLESAAGNIQKLHSNHTYTKDINSVSKNKVTDKNDISDTQLDKNINFDSISSKSIYNNICNNKLAGLSNITKLNSFGDKEKEKYPDGFLNNSTQKITGLEDISKDSKTSNFNVLVTKQETNNEIRFDSEKYPRNDNVRRRETLNLNAFHIYENNTACGKRGKSIVTHYNCAADIREGLDFKRLKLHQRESSIRSGGDEMDTVIECDQEKNQRMEEERKHRLPVNKSLLEKNYRMECERKQRELQKQTSPSGAGPSSACGENCNLEPQVEENEGESRESTLSMELEAEKHWAKHLASHQSVIVDTFQGQFKSTVVCSGCKYVSVTYEPFMYLSVPLPHAMERQICVTFVGEHDAVPIQYMLTVNKRDKVSCLKKQLLQLMGKPSLSLVMTEVLDNHIAKILDENYLVRYVDVAVRSLYAFEVITFHSSSSTESSLDEGKDLECNNENIGISDNDACTICLEEVDSNMNRHIGCTCVLCDSCIATSSQHYGEGTLICPVCRMKLTPGTDLVAVQHTPNTKPAIRMLNIPLVFRLDTFGDGNNNMKTVQLFGHPRLLRLPNHLQSVELHDVVASLIPYSLPHKLLYVDGQGHHCSRCMFNSHCRGCPVPIEGPLMLHTGDTLAVMFSEPVEEIVALKHSTMHSLRTQHSLSLYDCIRAFSQSEALDEHNPWYCPKCQQNQCATKTLSVWRYPSYLIVYLKRFVFHNCVSMKLEDKVMFPLSGLNLDSHSSLYDLYACVCHVGGVSAGHYTAYTLHPYTGEWHYFNDDYVTKQMPQEDDYSNAYILFYKMRGADVTNQGDNSNSQFSFPSHSHS